MTISIIPNFLRPAKVDPSIPSNAESGDPPKKYFPETPDPLVVVRNIFSPYEIPTRLTVEENLFSRTGETFPIKKARSKTPFHNLQVREKHFGGGEMILEDATTGKPQVVIVRYITDSEYRFHIYLTRPVYEEQEPINRMNVKVNERLYHFAKVVRGSSNTLQVFLAQDEATPAYTIQKARAVSYPTKHTITQHDGKTVATTQKWDNKSHMLEVKPGTDASVMVCLVAITDEMDKQLYNETRKFIDFNF